MKLTYLTTLYPLYVQKFYSKYPELVNMPFSEQQAALDYDAFGWADMWNETLKPLGYDVCTIRANVMPLQCQWAIEKGLPINGDWVLDIAGAQIAAYEPDIIFVDDYEMFSDQWLTEIRQSCPSVKLIFGWCGAPYSDPSVFKAYNFVLSCVPELVMEFQSMGHKALHVNHAFDPRILDKIDLQKDKCIDFSFVGQIALLNRYHIQRAQLLSVIAQTRPIAVFSPMAEADQQLIALQPSLYPSVFGLDMFQTLRISRVTFNAHIDISAHYAANMRLYEATGVGTCLITDWKKNMHELFEPDREVITFKTAGECVEKVRWLLDHPVERQAIADAGQRRTLKDHTIARRAEQIDEIIRGYFLGSL